jgi:hypothetical protein
MVDWPDFGNLPDLEKWRDGVKTLDGVMKLFERVRKMMPKKGRTASGVDAEMRKRFEILLDVVHKMLDMMKEEKRFGLQVAKGDAEVKHRIVDVLTSTSTAILNVISDLNGRVAALEEAAKKPPKKKPRKRKS